MSCVGREVGDKNDPKSAHPQNNVNELCRERSRGKNDPKSAHPQSNELCRARSYRGVKITLNPHIRKTMSCVGHKVGEKMTLNKAMSCVGREVGGKIDPKSAHPKSNELCRARNRG